MRSTFRVRDPRRVLKVLVVDDDDIAREVMCSVLRAAGHSVYELPSAIGATRAIYRYGVDAVVLDISMPGLNGDKLGEVLRQNAQGRNLAMVLVSSRPMVELERLARVSQADGVVSKSDIRLGLTSEVMRAWRTRNPVTVPSGSTPSREESEELAVGS